MKKKKRSWKNVNWGLMLGSRGILWQERLSAAPGDFAEKRSEGNQRCRAREEIMKPRSINQGNDLIDGNLRLVHVLENENVL